MDKPRAAKGPENDRTATADEVGILVGTLILRDHLVALRRRQLTGEQTHEFSLEDLQKTLGPIATLTTLSHKRADLLIDAHKLVGNAEASAKAARERATRLGAACKPCPEELVTEAELEDMGE